MLRGVISVAPGYVSHVEVIRFEYDPSLISYDDLLDVFFATHDPTTVNRQGNDIGPQYRSVVFYSTPEQKAAADQHIAALNASSTMGAPIVTTVEPLTEFRPAEDYHVKYYENHRDAAYCQLVINPKLEKVQEKFAELLKK